MRTTSSDSARRLPSPGSDRCWPLPDVSRSLDAAMVRFAALLRRHGLPVTPEHVTDGVRALEQLDLADRAEVRTGLRAVFAGRSEDFATFDRAFDAFWRAGTEADRVAEALAPPGLPEPAPPGLEGAGRETLALDAWQEAADGDSGEAPVGVPAASELEAMAARDFSTFSPGATFPCSVRLTRVTDYLRARSYREVLRRLTAVRDWSGGTRIGESLAEFNRGWPSLVDRRTIVIILSDGWDTGDPDVLAAELLRIKRRAGRVIWLNPLLGNPSYEPLTRGMAAALPLVDRFAAAHNLTALRHLAGSLSL